MPIPVNAGKVAALAFTTDPGVNVYVGCVLKLKCHVESPGDWRILCRSRFVVASFKALLTAGWEVLSTAVVKGRRVRRVLRMEGMCNMVRKAVRSCEPPI